MSIHEQRARGLTPGQRLDELAHVLMEALGTAERCSFALPSHVASAVTMRLLGQLAIASEEIETIDVVVGEDGSIEVTAAPAKRLITFDISQSGAKSEMVVRDTAAGKMIASLPAATEADFVKWLAS
jgi:hypothetical protein